MESRALTVLACLLAALITACASSPELPPPAEASRVTSFEEGVPGRVVVDTVQVSARVVAVDKVARKATLLGADGEEFTVKVGPQAVNFDQVEVGDVVRVTLTEALLISLADEGTAVPDTSAGVVALAPVGAQPGGVVAEATRVTGTVIGIDPVQHTATLRFQDGSTRTLPVREDVDLSQRRVGEHVVFEMIESVAIDVQKP